MAKGPKYLESQSINFPKAKQTIISGMKDCVTKWCDKHVLTTIIMAPYMHSLESLLDARISELQHLQPSQHSSIFNESSVKDSLNQFQDRFVIVPIDKTTGNVVFIYKRFYAKVILRELGLNTNVNSATYSAVNDSCHNIIKQYTNFLLQQFGLSSTEKVGCRTFIGCQNYISLQLNSDFLLRYQNVLSSC